MDIFDHITRGVRVGKQVIVLLAKKIMTIRSILIIIYIYNIKIDARIKSNCRHISSIWKKKDLAYVRVCTHLIILLAALE